MSLGAGLLFDRQMEDVESVLETCLKLIIILQLHFVLPEAQQLNTFCV